MAGLLTLWARWPTLDTSGSQAQLDPGTRFSRVKLKPRLNVKCESPTLAQLV